MNEIYDIIQTVCLTEKATLLSEKENKYVFRVNPKANKLVAKEQGSSDAQCFGQDIHFIRSLLASCISN